VHQDSGGTDAQNLNLVVPSIGAITGNANVNSNGQLDCKMVAKLSASGALGAMSSTFSTITAGGKSQKNNGIPFKIQGTTSNPVFLPDVEGMAGSLAKDAASTPVNAATAAGNALGSLLGKKKKPQ
jgi:AsmA protein